MAGYGFNIGLDGHRVDPLTEKDAENIAEGLTIIYGNARERMLKTVASRFSRGVHGYGWAERKASEILDAHHQMEVIYDRAARQRESLLSGVMERAYATGNQKFHADMRSVLGATAHISPNGMKAGYILADLNNALNAAERRILRQFDDKYANIIGAVSAEMATGVMNTRQAVGEALQQFADQGITGFIDRGGHHWTLENYAEMAVLTAIERSTVSGYVDTMQSYGYDLAVIDGHVGSCPVCEAWEGVIVSVSGDNHDYPSLDEAEGAGVFHPRCLHGITTYYPDITHVPKGGFRDEPREVREPSRQYTARSKQRYMERQIRKYKDRALVAQTPLQKRQAMNKVHEWEDALDDMIEHQPSDDYLYRHRSRETSEVGKTFRDVTDQYTSAASPSSGTLSYDPNYEKSRRHANEERIAEWLHSTFGGDIRLLAESPVDGVKMPDYQWRGSLWELKSPTTTTAAKSAVRKALEQIAPNPGGVVLDYGKSPFDLAEVLHNAESQTKRNGLGCDFDLMILKDGSPPQIYRHKK